MGKSIWAVENGCRKPLSGLLWDRPVRSTLESTSNCLSVGAVKFLR